MKQLCKKKLKSVGLLILICSVCLFGFMSISTSDETISKIRKIYQKINNQKIGNNTFYYKIGVTSTTNVEEIKVLPEEIVELYFNKQQSRYYNTNIILLEDETDAFTIIPKNKLILWRTSLRHLYKNNQVSKMFSMQDSMLSLLNVIKTSKLVENGRTILYIETRLPEASQANYNINVMNFKIDERNEEIKELEINHLVPVNNAIRVKYRFYDIDFKKNLNEPDLPVKKLVFSAGKTLRPEYKEYKIQDIRNLK